MKFSIGTRGSDLARRQGEMVAERLRSGIKAEVGMVNVSTTGDREQDQPLTTMDGRGVFIRELEEALRDGRIDIAVHSLKDMPLESPSGLETVAFTSRADAADVLVIRREAWEKNPPPGSKSGVNLNLSAGSGVGTGSPRRSSQLLALRNDLKVQSIRGNVPTRLSKLAGGKYDAVVLAAAGLERLSPDLQGCVVARLPLEYFVPAPGQGVLAVQMRAGDERREAVQRTVHNREAWLAAAFEREVLRAFGGGCGLPLGVHACRGSEGWGIYGFWGGGDLPRWGRLKNMDLNEKNIISTAKQLRAVLFRRGSGENTS